MQDRPTAPELLDAMAAHLFTEVREWVPRERRFQILVLANLCAVLGRELRAGEAPDRADLALFSKLLADPVDDPDGSADDSSGADEDSPELARELSRRIRAGDFDHHLPETIEALQRHVARKLEINRPGYDAASGQS